VTTTSRWLAWGFVAIAAVVFVLRGPARTVRSGDDFAPPYGAARAWLFGENPYDNASLSRVLLAAGRETDAAGKPAFNPSLYPPSTLVVLAPFALLSWPAARVAFLIVCVLLFAWHLKPLFRVAGLSLRDDIGVWLLGGVLALAPYHTGIALSQVAIPCVALLVIAIDRIQRGQETSGGNYLALATLFKPQLAAPFILYYFLRRHTRAALVALAICVVAAIVGVAWLTINHVPWMASWSAATKAVATAGIEHDPAGPFSAQLLELRPLITALSGIRSSGTIGLVIAALAGLGVYVWGRSLSERRDLLLLSAVAVLTILAVYHRFYDAAILSLPLAWAASTYTYEPPLRRVALGAAICCAVFFAPGAWMMQRLVNDGTVSADVANSFIWNAILIRHQNWALVALMALLFVAIYRVRNWESGMGNDSMKQASSRNSGKTS
jgi:hypothetical protein